MHQVRDRIRKILFEEASARMSVGGKVSDPDKYQPHKGYNKTCTRHSDRKQGGIYRKGRSTI